MKKLRFHGYVYIRRCLVRCNWYEAMTPRAHHENEAWLVRRGKLALLHATLVFPSQLWTRVSSTTLPSRCSTTTQLQNRHTTR